MLQVVEQTKEEKVAMYMKLSKKELVAMLIENQRINDEILAKPTITITGEPATSNWVNYCNNFEREPKCTANICKHCGQSEYNHQFTYTENYGSTLNL
jgi:hypothetical protein